MEASFAKAMPFVFGHEGGYVDDPQDPGGATNMGITFATLQDWRGHPITKADVKNLTRAEAMEIYRENYWNAISGDKLPAGVDYAVFDFGINSGVSRAAKALQRLVGTEQDGEIGPLTVKAARAVRMSDHLVMIYCGARLSFLRGLSTWDRYGGGWESRVSDVRAHALQWAREAPPGDEPPDPVTDTLESLAARVAACEARLDATEPKETKMAEVKIDVAKLNAAIQAGMQKKVEEKTASPAKREALEAFPSVKAGFAQLGVIEDAQATFCTAWPKVKPVLDTGIKFAAWFMPAATIKLAKSVVNAIDTMLFPAICQPQ